MRRFNLLLNSQCVIRCDSMASIYLSKRYGVLSSAFLKITTTLPSCSSLQNISELILDIAAWSNIDVIRLGRGFSTLSINGGELYMHAFYNPELESLNSVSIVDVDSGKQVSIMDGISCNGFNALASTFKCIHQNKKNSVA
jgi:hypothetical protein